MNDKCDPATLVPHLLERVIDSFEKLDIALLLYTSRTASRSTLSIAESVFLSPRRARDAIAALSSAGVIRALDAHGSIWCFDPNSSWGPSVEALALMYETSRTEVLELMTIRMLATMSRSTRGER